MKTLKKPVNLLCLVAVALILVQIMFMFLPCFSMSPKPTRRNPNPPVTNYSLMNYCWTDSEAMESGLSERIPNYIKNNRTQINKHVTNFVLICVLSLLAIIFTLIDFKNAYETFKTLGQTVIKILSHICCLSLGGLGVYTYATSEILRKAGSSSVQTLCLVACIAIALASIARVVLDLAPSFKKAEA